MENFIWMETKTYDKLSEFSESERKQWESFISDEKSDWDDYEGEQEQESNGYRIDIWSWNNQILKNIIAFPGDTPVGALFLNDDSTPVITESDGDLSNSYIDPATITTLQQELQNNLKPWKHIQRTFEEPCSKNHPHCIAQYEKKKFGGIYLNKRNLKLP